MHSIWVFLKEKVNCGSKLSDVIRRQQNRNAGKYISRKENPESKHIHGVNNKKQIEVLQKRYSELTRGDPSRSIIEMIFHAALTNPMNQSRRKIRRVLKVKSSLETVERFEKYREMVKKMANAPHKRQHTRSMVDGNELLQFYGTIMACCQPKQMISELCKLPNCGVCRIIQSNFETDWTNKYGILLSSSSEGLSDTTMANSRERNQRRAVIVCRTIAGRVDSVFDAENEGNCVSSASKRWNNRDYLIVDNSNAILSCFVIVFS